MTLYQLKAFLCVTNVTFTTKTKLSHLLQKPKLSRVPLILTYLPDLRSAIPFPSPYFILFMIYLLQ